MDNKAAPNERLTVGEHSLDYELDTGFFHLIHVGQMNGSEMTKIADNVAELAKKHNPGEASFMLVDNRKAAGISNEGRRVMSQSPVVRDELYVALFGASFVVRAVINMVFKAVAIASSSKSVAVAVATETEARAWLSEQRQAYRTRGTKSVA
ncbi:MAG TPA: hypothetical protein VM580_03680 [Labilithrix sp.]|jgi:hypothetical protein|nr:hypothetical protein [Labilithrix sp.]